MRYFVGIDLHSDNNYIGVLDKKDSRIFRTKLPNDLDTILKILEPFKKKEIQGIVVRINEQLVLVGRRITGNEIPGAPGQSCGNAAVFWHKTRMTSGIPSGLSICCV